MIGRTKPAKTFALPVSLACTTTVACSAAISRFDPTSRRMVWPMEIGGPSRVRCVMMAVRPSPMVEVSSTVPVPALMARAAPVANTGTLLRQPEMVVGTWRAARRTAPDVTEQEVLLALERIEPLWDELFPAERARIVRLLVDRVDIQAEGAVVRLRLDGLGSLVRDLAAHAPEAGRAPA
ncbi:hypothetical protein [Roseomonas sp. HF4]|uniref:hypothetical protein n=1 Tax=Roseomonas sp. HF4 TaxID=2562313 RepID=UPI00197E6E32|nr:hypothetical protein [Roseomonas sp. HF4]